MKIKVVEATGIVLDWLVAKIEFDELPKVTPGGYATVGFDSRYRYSPSSDWAQGGPIIEREGIGHFCNRTTKIGTRFKPDAGADWRAFEYNKHGVHYFGPTPLIAAMRCYVTSKLGEKVEVPDELLNPM